MALKNEKQLVRLAFLAGPLLMLAASLIFATGLGMKPGDKSNFLEGIVGCYGIVLFIPVYWELSALLGRSKKILATITYITGLLGPATGFTHMYTRIFEYELRLHGAGDAVWMSLSLILAGILFPAAMISTDPFLLQTAYPAACTLWALVFVAYATRYMKQGIIAKPVADALRA